MVCVTDCQDRDPFPAVTFTNLADTLNIEVSAITSVQLTMDASLPALVNLTIDSNETTSCPFLRVVAGNERPRDEHSSVGWSFGSWAKLSDDWGSR
eukprot:Skav228941  [mRNA]  locus=scaffold2181:372939:373344:- [translate_table: standard]